MCLLAALTADIDVAWADEPPPAGHGDPAAVDAPADPGDPAWQLYDEAFERLAAGDIDGARVRLLDLQKRYPGHPAATRAAQRSTEIANRSTNVDQPASESRRPDSLLLESNSQLARAELALYMTLNGTLFGRDVCQMLECTGARSTVAALMLGSGAGLGLSLYFARDGITQGHAQLLNSAITWGTWNGLLINDGLADNAQQSTVEALMQGVGLGTGLALWHLWRPTSGQVALTNTGGVWTTVLTLFAMAAADEDFDLGTMVLAGDAGLLMGGWLANSVPMSRGRTLLIDTGGILGMLFGGLIASGMDDENAIFGTLFVTTALGLGVSAGVSRSWDVPDPPRGTALGIVPMGVHGDGWGAVLSMGLDL